MVPEGLIGNYKLVYELHGIHSNYTTWSVSVMIVEGESEGELPGIAQDLIDAFDSTDTDQDGQLSFAEASSLVGALTQVQFDEIDIDNDGFLIQSELAAQVVAGEGEGEGEGEDPTGPNCNASKILKENADRFFGDLFLLGLSLVVLLGGQTVGRKL